MSAPRNPYTEPRKDGWFEWVGAIIVFLVLIGGGLELLLRLL